MSRRKSQITPEQRARWIEWLNRPVLPPSGAQLDMFESFRVGMDPAREVPRRRVRSSRG